MKEKALDKATIDAYQEWVQDGIRKDLNSISLGPGKLPFRSGVFLVICAICCLLVGILLVSLRMRHVYLWDWDAQFLGPFFFILFLLCMAFASYMFITAKQRSNKYRSELYFRPIGDWGVACVHKSELALEEEMKHELKSGTNPHKVVRPRSEAYSQSSKGGRRQMQQAHRTGRDNYGYDKSPLDVGKPFRHVDRRQGPPPEGQRGFPSEGRRGPPPPLDGRRGPPSGGRLGPPPGGQLGPPPDRRGPPPGRHEPPPDRHGPPPGRHEPPPDRRGPPPGRHEPPPDRRGPPPGRHEPPPDRRGPPPGRHEPAPDGRRGPPTGDRFESQGLAPSDRNQGLEHSHQVVRSIQGMPRDDFDI